MVTEALSQPGPGEPLAPRPAAPPQAAPGERDLKVLACAPGWLDLDPPPGIPWPRVPGAALAGRDQDGRTWLCAGLLPCGDCQPCQAALHLACERPTRPGLDVPGGLAPQVALPAPFLAPLQQAHDPAQLAAAVALVAAAGPCYQAAASAGMVPGDTVLVLGSPGPGELPLRVLLDLGLNPVRLGPAGGSGGDLVPAVEHPSALPELPSPRWHLLDLCPTAESLELCLPLLARAISLTLLGPGLPARTPPLQALLPPQVTLRRVVELHPQLSLELAAAALTGRLDPTDGIEPLPAARFSEAFWRLCQGRARRWPVLLWDAPQEH
jgi:D-arabinose 1-dehydrogenase-like Zn-dependent alcohol dehydrogenase